VAGADGVTSVAAVDRYIDNLETHLGIDRNVSDSYKAAHFAWRGVSASAAASISTKMFFPSRTQIEVLLATAGLSTSIISAGHFPLAQFTPIYLYKAQ